MAEVKDPNDGTATNPGLPGVRGDVINDEVLQQGSPYAATATVAAQKIERTKVAMGDIGVDDGNVHDDNPLPTSETKIDTLIRLLALQVRLLQSIERKLSYEGDDIDEFTDEADDDEIDIGRLDLEGQDGDEDVEDQVESVVT